IPNWPETQLDQVEELTATVLFESLFNQTSDDALRFLVRMVDIIAGDPEGGPIDSADWKRIQENAFGCPYLEYVESFIAPLFILSRGWEDSNPPLLDPAAWERGPSAGLYQRWFLEASMSLDTDRSALSARALANGLFRLPGIFFRRPFVRLGDKLL